MGGPALHRWPAATPTPAEVVRVQRTDAAEPDGGDAGSAPGVPAERVRDALAHLYDPAHLQTHPLATLVGGGDRAGRGRALQRALLEAVEALEPAQEGTPGPRALRRYRLLKRRYVDGLTPEAVQGELRIGRSEYYREHQRALEAVAALLAERAGVAPAPAGAGPAPAGAAPETTGALPVYLTSFVGREAESAEVAALLAGTRLLTLTGAGGCGKTRLAVQVAAGLAGAYEAGVWFVDLAPIADPSLVPQTTLNAVGGREVPGEPVTSTLVAHLRDKRALLLLDNCEHLIDACAHLAEGLLRGCSGLRVLATSRERLDLAGEVAWRVPSLELPGSEGEQTPATLAGCEAVGLFVERTRLVEPAFELTEQNAPALAELCRRLDGVPLAIELAAARVRVLTVEQIAERLRDRFGVLAGGGRTTLPRQRTLRATVDWSHDLLTASEQAVFRRLAVFAGGWTLDAAEAVCGFAPLAPAEVLDRLTALVDKSLVMAEPRGAEERYRLLETVRQYGQEKLLAAGEQDETRDRHRDWCLALAERAEPELWRPAWRRWLDRLETEHDNLRAALEWGLSGGGAAGGESALRLAGALAQFWWTRSHFDEGRRWLTRALALPGRSAARAKALHGAGWLAHFQRDAATARTLLAESLAIARELDDRAAVAWVLHVLGRVAYFDEDAASARALGEQSLAIAEALGDRWLIAWALHLLGLAAHVAADYTAAEDFYRRSLAIRQEIGHRVGIGILFQLMGMVAQRQGDLARARGLYLECLPIFLETTSPWQLGNILALFASLAAMQRQPERAARLIGATAVATESSHTLPIPLTEALFKEGLELARRALGETRFAAAVAEGQAMTLEQAVADALNDAGEEAATGAMTDDTATAPPTGAPDRPTGAAGVLSPREREVAALIARGYTNRRISEALVIAETTAERHVANILAKLGAHARSEVAAWAATHLPPEDTATR